MQTLNETQVPSVHGKTHFNLSLVELKTEKIALVCFNK